jgi:hypothetical protein
VRALASIIEQSAEDRQMTEAFRSFSDDRGEQGEQQESSSF